jgi:hypothetical protein
MTTLAHTVDNRTGRPLVGGHEAIESLSDADLEREITIAALEHVRVRRFEALLAERRRRLSDWLGTRSS